MSISGFETPAIHEPKTMPKVVIAPSKPFITKYRLAIPVAFVTLRYTLTFLKNDSKSLLNGYLYTLKWRSIIAHI
jgi:hypothetical protein